MAFEFWSVIGLGVMMSDSVHVGGCWGDEQPLGTMLESIALMSHLKGNLGV